MNIVPYGIVPQFPPEGFLEKPRRGKNKLRFDRTLKVNERTCAFLDWICLLSSSFVRVSTNIVNFSLLRLGMHVLLFLLCACVLK